MPIVVSNHQGLAARIFNAFSRVARFALSIGVGWCQQPPWLFNHADLCVCCNRRRFYIAVLCGIPVIWCTVCHTTYALHNTYPLYSILYTKSIEGHHVFFHYLSCRLSTAVALCRWQKFASFFVSMSNKQWSYTFNMVWKWCVYIKLYQREKLLIYSS